MSDQDGSGSLRLEVKKTYKLFINGAFPRSESGRTYPVHGPGGDLLANAARASRKDLRDAVTAARAAQPVWAFATAYNRGQVLYRVAELLEERQGEFVRAIVAAEGRSESDAKTDVAASIDRWVWYAGWSDKVAQVAGNANPVAGPYFNFSVPEPTGVVGLVAPNDSSLLGLVSVLAPALTTGNTVIVLASERFPLPAVSLGEVLATSDVPKGVVNILTGTTAELAPVLASHRDVDALDIVGASGPLRIELQQAASENIKRVVTKDESWLDEPSLTRLFAFIETKTVWHPIGR